ncbi:MAG: preprotein translocase subunit YajC [Oligoflexia bacterium]|nr:preprotein translocase subunit YajC [Oligoflexia bacterium]
MKSRNIFLVLIACLVLLGSADPVMAQAAAPQPHQPSFGEVLTRMMPMFLICYLMFHFLVIKPQKEKLKKHEELLSSLKKGDTIVSTGGLIGRVAGIEKDYILLEVSQNVRIRVLPGNVERRFGEETADADKSAKASNGN